MTVPAVLVGLLEDAALVAGLEAATAVRGHRELGRGPAGPLLAPLAVPDRRLAEVARAATGQDPVAVSVINSSGAGGLLNLADRALTGLRVMAVESALRDLDDLAGNAARLVAAARQLDPWEVYVEIPYAPGWERAVTVVEAGGLHAAVQAGPVAAVGLTQLAEQLSVLIEADVPFKTIGAGVSTLGVLAAVEALVDGAAVPDAARLLSAGDQAMAARVTGWDDTTAGRVRRRLRLVACSSVPDAVADLVAAGVLSAA